jgi:acyltransferase
MSATPAGRDTHLDAARAIAIVLVVLGHARGIPGTFALLVFSFNVPLFFVVSGWVTTAHGRARSDAQALARLARGLLLPYLGFFVLAYLYWLLTRHIGEKALRWGDVPWWDPLAGALVANGPGLYVQPALWFLPALFVTALAFHHLAKWMVAWRLAMAMAVLAWAWIAWFAPLGVRLPWGLDVLPVALFFFACGAAVGRFTARARAFLEWKGTALPLVVAWLPLAWLNGRVDVNMLRFGHWPPLFLLVALLGAALVFNLAGWIQRWPAVQWVGRNTLLILGSHFPVFFFLSGIRSLAGVQSPPGPGWALGISAVALLVAVPLRWILMRWAPWMLGAGPQARVPAVGMPEAGPR